MSKRTRLTKSKFHAINRDLKLHNRVNDVAAVHGVSEETVRTVKRAKTWPGFESMKQTKREQRRRIATGPVNGIAVQQSLGSDLVEKQLDAITQAPHDTRPKAGLIKVVTVDEWETLNRKLGLLYRMIEPNKGFLNRLWGRK